MSSQTEEVKPGSAPKSGVGRAKGRDRVTRIDSTFVDAEVLQCLRVVVKRNSSGSCKRHQPDDISGGNMQWARPDANLIVANVLEALSEMGHAADYELRGWLLLVFRGLIR